MFTLELSDEQVADLVRQLPPDRRRNLLVTLAAQAREDEPTRHVLAEQSLRRFCAQRGRDWDTLSEQDREQLVNDLIHEDRSCR